jgi:hypothetical protein
MPSRVKALTWMLLTATLLAASQLGIDASAVLTDQATVPDNTFTTPQAFP